MLFKLISIAFLVPAFSFAGSIDPNQKITSVEINCPGPNSLYLNTETGILKQTAPAPTDDYVEYIRLAEDNDFPNQDPQPVEYLNYDDLGLRYSSPADFYVRAGNEDLKFDPQSAHCGLAYLPGGLKSLGPVAMKCVMRDLRWSLRGKNTKVQKLVLVFEVFDKDDLITDKSVGTLVNRHKQIVNFYFPYQHYLYLMKSTDGTLSPVPTSSCELDVKYGR